MTLQGDKMIAFAEFIEHYLDKVTRIRCEQDCLVNPVTVSYVYEELPEELVRIEFTNGNSILVEGDLSTVREELQNPTVMKGKGKIHD